MPANVLVNKARRRGISSPGADTPLFPQSVVWQSSNMCRLTIQLTDTESVVKITSTEGGSTVKFVMNNKVAIPFGAAYVLDLGGMRPGDQVNVELATDVDVDSVALDEVLS